ncbi:hypothetical protein ACLBR5_03755 [Escherichia coli]
MHNAVVLKNAPIWWIVPTARAAAPAMQNELLDKHYLRKHGANAYYGRSLCWGFIAPGTTN